MMTRNHYLLFLIITCLFFSCRPQPIVEPGDLVINDIEFEETLVILSLPDGVYMPDNPDFDFSIPSTWTGNMAQYVIRNYIYSVSYTLSNLGGSPAYNTEVDLYYIFDDGEEEVETISLGVITPNDGVVRSVSVSSVNKQLTTCEGEVFWFD